MQGHQRYQKIIEALFFNHYREGSVGFIFSREEIAKAAEQMKVEVPKNLGDVLYTFRYRQGLPERIQQCAPKGKQWIIRGAGRGKYEFATSTLGIIQPAIGLAKTKILNATPEVVARYSLTDEQALLAIVRYNRLLDIFTSTTCYSLQSHLRTTIVSHGQVETDELYIGVDRRGAHYVFPVQAKGGKDILSVVQIEQDFALCQERFPSLVPRPVAIQFISDRLVAMIEFEQTKDREIVISGKKHYELVSRKKLTDKELEIYASRRSD